MKQLYTISIYAENKVGLLNRVSSVFLQRHINIESLNTSKSEIKDVNRFVIVAYVLPENIEKLVKQIEKQVAVIKAYYHTDDEIIYQESALFKVKSDLLFDDRQIQNIVKNSNARIVTVNREFFVVEKSGRRHEIDELHEQFRQYGIMQFVRAGRIAVTKEEMKISEILQQVYQ